MQCKYCGEMLDKEEAGSPRHDSAGDLMCNECYQDHYQFECCWCEDYADLENENQDEMLVVFDAKEAFHEDERETGYREGVYRITDYPYYCSNYFMMWLYVDCLERIADIPKGASDNGYACGHLCQDCQKKILIQGTNHP